MTRKVAPKLTHVIEMAWRCDPDRRFDDAEIEGALRELRALKAVARAAEPHVRPQCFMCRGLTKAYGRATRCSLCRALARLKRASGGGQ